MARPPVVWAFMDETDTPLHSFVVRIWLEEAAGAERPARWRGHITHIPSQERDYIESLEELCRFMTPYLKAMGV